MGIERSRYVAAWREDVLRIEGRFFNLGQERSHVALKTPECIFSQNVGAQKLPWVNRLD